jgi:hypothetical protein
LDMTIDTFSIGSAILLPLILFNKFYTQPFGFGIPAILAAFFAGPLGNS